MQPLSIDRVSTLIERGPVVLVTTSDGQQDNVMTVSWTMVTGYGGTLAMATGPWNHSYKTLKETRECVVAVPSADLLDAAVTIGTQSGAVCDKFATTKLTRRPSERVRPPGIEECLANIECRVVELLDRHNIVILEAVAAHAVEGWEAADMLHAVGDGTFLTGGKRLDRRDAMRAKLPPGL